jgi:hypothetical protein
MLRQHTSAKPVPSRCYVHLDLCLCRRRLLAYFVLQDISQVQVLRTHEDILERIIARGLSMHVFNQAINRGCILPLAGL